MTDFRIVVLASGVASSAWEAHRNYDDAARSAIRSALAISADLNEAAPVVVEAAVEQAFTSEKRRFRVTVEELL